MENMDNVYMQSIQSNENRFSKLMDKFDDVISKKTNVERDNGELRTRLSNLNHTSTLEKEILKTNLESKCTLLKQQNEAQMDKMNKLISDMDRISNDLTQKSAKIDSLESALARVDHQLEQKDQEILSLKLHSSKDDTGGEFQEVVRKKTNNNHHDHVVTLIGSSNTNGINPQKLSSNYNLNKIQAFTLEQTEREIRNLHPTPSVLVLHTLTNDLKTKTPTTCVDEMDRICKTIHELYSNTKIILSLPTPRGNSQEYNNKGQLITAMIKDKFRTN